MLKVTDQSTKILKYLGYTLLGLGKLIYNLSSSPALVVSEESSNNIFHRAIFITPGSEQYSCTAV